MSVDTVERRHMSPMSHIVADVHAVVCSNARKALLCHNGVTTDMLIC